ncbi:transposase, IS630 family [Candidatus Magnetomorum sp. HK-1]|nr:transposase, IS630 family [Candidatus Magnetomorum sp. HK-1]
MKNYHFTTSEIEELKEHRDQCYEYRLRDRFLALLLIGTLQLSILEVSKLIGKSTRTIERWLDKYFTKGIKALTQYDYKSKESYLSFYQKNQLHIYVAFDNPNTIGEVACYIKDQFGIDYSQDAVRSILKKMGLKVIRSKTVPGNPPSVEEQENFIKKYLFFRYQPNSVTLFGDGMHLIHQNLPFYCWGDPSFPPIIETNTSRKRLNILGAYNPADYSFLHVSSENNCNAERVIEFLELILKKYSNIPIINIVLDNARYFHALIVRDWLKSHKQINIIFLPAYAPNLNLIERFWKFAKKKLVRGHYYKTYKEFRAKTFQFLNNVQDHTEILKTLMTEKFQIVRA